MRVLNVNAILDPVTGGGTAERTFQLSRFLTRAGTTCHVLTLDVSLQENRIVGLGAANVTALHCFLPRYYLFRLPEPRIRELVREADVVHIMGHWTLLNVLVYRTARELQKPYVVCPAGALPIFGRSPVLKTLYNRVIGRRIVHHADAWVAIGSNEREHFQAYGVEPEHVTLIPNGINPDDYRSFDDASFRRTFGLPPVPFVLFLGRLNPIKGPDLLLRGFAAVSASVPDVQLVYAGPDGGMLNRLREDAARAGIGGRVHFIGPVSGPVKSQALHAASILAVPSRQEAMSIVALEAGACGTPVIITDRCGFDEIAESGGALVVPADEPGIRNGLVSMLKNADRLAAMGEKLRRFVCARYLWTHAAESYLALFRRVMAEHRRT